MELHDAIRNRRSIRAFLPDPVSSETINGLLEEAHWAPSWANAQAWDVWVVTGERLDAVKRMLAEKAEQEAAPVPDVRMPARGEWPEHVKERMTYRRPAPGVEPAPPQRPKLWEVYGAPALILFGVHEQLAVEYACYDLGALVQTFCLAAVDRGLGTCIMAMVVRNADALHDLIPESEGRRFVVGVALGVPDRESPLNNVPRERCQIGEIATCVM